MAVCSLYEISSFLNRFFRSRVCFPVVPLKNPVLDCFAVWGIQRAGIFWRRMCRRHSFLGRYDQKRWYLFVTKLPVHAPMRQWAGISEACARVGVVVLLIRILGGPYADKKRKINSHITEIFLKQFTQFLPQYLFWVRHESASPLVAESATGKVRPSTFRT